MTKLTDQDRARIVKQYRLSGLTQAGFCYVLAAADGIHISPRTLRSWRKKFGWSAESVDEIREILIETHDRAGRLLEWLRARIAAEAASLESKSPPTEDLDTSSRVEVDGQQGTWMSDSNRTSIVDGTGTSITDGAGTSIMDSNIDGLNTAMDGQSGMPEATVSKVQAPPTKRRRGICLDFS